MGDTVLPEAEVAGNTQVVEADSLEDIALDSGHNSGLVPPSRHNIHFVILYQTAFVRLFISASCVNTRIVGENYSEKIA